MVSGDLWRDIKAGIKKNILFCEKKYIIMSYVHKALLRSRCDNKEVSQILRFKEQQKVRNSFNSRQIDRQDRYRLY